MPPLEQLFRLETEFHRRMRTHAFGIADAGSLHTSYALQSGYDQPIRQLGRTTASDLEHIRQRHASTADARDLLAASDSLKQLLGIPQPGT